MGLVAVGEQYLLPQHAWSSNAPGYNQATLNVADAKIAAVTYAPKAGEIEALALKLGAVTTAEDLKVSLQNIDATTGFPDGVVDQYRVISSGSLSANAWIETGRITTDGTDGGTRRTVARDDPIGIVVEYDAWVAGNLQVSRLATGSVPESVEADPYSGTYAGGSWSKSPLGLAWAMKYADGSYAMVAPTWLPASAFNSHTFNSGSDPDEYAAALTVLAPMGLSAIHARIDMDGDASFVAYRDTTALATFVGDKDVRGSTAGHAKRGPLGSSVAVAVGDEIRCSVKPTTTTNVVVYSFDVANTGIMAALPYGTSLRSATRVDGGSWTINDTRRYFITPKYDRLEDGVSTAQPLIVNRPRPVHRERIHRRRAMLIVPGPAATVDVPVPVTARRLQPYAVPGPRRRGPPIPMPVVTEVDRPVPLPPRRRICVASAMSLRQRTLPLQTTVPVETHVPIPVRIGRRLVVVTQPRRLERPIPLTPVQQEVQLVIPTYRTVR